jgi:hypothetical protein
MSKRLPLLVEQSVLEAQASRQELALKFNQNVMAEPGAVSCRKGCHHCCYHPVMLSVLEGVSLFRWLKDQGMWSTKTRDRFKEAQVKTWNLSIEVWALSMIACPLLKDGECSAYEGRPLPCRITVSKSDPYDCHPHRLTGGRGLLPKRETFEDMARREASLLKRHDLKFVRVPLATAVLMGERIVTGELSFEDAYIHLVDQQLRNG